MNSIFWLPLHAALLRMEIQYVNDSKAWLKNNTRHIIAMFANASEVTGDPRAHRCSLWCEIIYRYFYLQHSNCKFTSFYRNHLRIGMFSQVCVKNRSYGLSLRKHSKTEQLRVYTCTCTCRCVCWQILTKLKGYKYKVCGKISWFPIVTMLTTGEVLLSACNALSNINFEVWCASSTFSGKDTLIHVSWWWPCHSQDVWCWWVQSKF